MSNLCKMSHSGAKKRRLDKNTQDNLYFDSYSDVTIHEEMIADTVRTNTYRMAILKNSKAIEGKVVLDVGAGTGVLSIFCVQAGARKVYAVEASSIADQAVRIVKLNKMEDRVDVIKGRLETIDLPEQVDVIVSEWMGYALLHESMLNSVIFARDKWLKPGGLILPCKAELYVAPINDLVVEDRLNFWSTVKDQYDVDMSCMSDFAKKCIMNKDITVNLVTVEDVLSHPSKFAELDLHTVTLEQLKSVRGQFHCECFGSSSVNALCVWFTVTFPSEEKPLVLSTSPFKPETHWKQAVLYLDEPVDVMQDTKVEGEINLFPSEESARHICIHVDYTIGNNKKNSKTFSIPDGYCETQS
ncbi:protein arginine N-methyltransferase 6 [Chanos chanos]|uniref:Protein arginine N-methyltransferase 6 n=1 Tax=Chanos chanos TaxID=29144 RepID=A0A6J2USL9_CHACN|nr:protein arginine N-methyltransferase 6 [Chanos chanos]